MNIYNMLFPNRCMFCFRMLEGEDDVCCRSCYEEVEIITEGYCSRCGKKHNQNEELCQDCSRSHHWFDSGRGMMTYNPAVKKSLFGLKSYNKTWIGKRMGLLMADYYKKQRLWKVDMVIPVPVHRYRYVMRGYNQAEIIARQFSHETGIPLDSQLLFRKRYTKAKKLLTPVERSRDLEQVFGLNPQRLSSYQNQSLKVLVIDDIYTTGATVNGCAYQLKRLGFEKVYFLTAAIGAGY